MKMIVDEGLCIGCGNCEAVCPKVFKLVDDIAQVILTPVPPEEQEAALDAEQGCPVDAISHED